LTLTCPRKTQPVKTGYDYVEELIDNALKKQGDKITLVQDSILYEMSG
jgi:hypothetical protein